LSAAFGYGSGKTAVRRRAHQRCPPRKEVAEQHRAQIDLADAHLGLRVLDVDVTMGEVDVANVDAAQLGVAQPGAGEAGDDRSPGADPALRFLLAVGAPARRGEH
jgi:hypothetical protein